MKGPVKKTLPRGDETMKRKPPANLGLRPVRIEFDPKKAYTVEQLAEIGAIAVRWNQIEAHIDFIGSFILFSKSPLWLQIEVGKKSSSNTKIGLLEKCLEKAELLDDKSKQCITDCFQQVKQCRSYRNAIIHHHIYDHEKGIGTYVDESSSPYQILVSIDALTALYGLLCALLDELRGIDLLFRIETDAQRPGKVDKATGTFQPFDADTLRKTIIPDHTKRILALQKTRKELPKLPKFPDAELIRAMNAEEDTGTIS